MLKLIMKLMKLKRVVIARHERGLYVKDRDLEDVLLPGVHWVFDPLGRKQVVVYDVSVPEFEYARSDVLLKEQRDLCESHFQVVELGDRQVGLVYKDGKLSGVLPTGKRQLYWRGPVEVRVEVLDIGSELEVPKSLADLLVRARPGLLPKTVAEYLYSVEVGESMTGLLYVNGELASVLKPGLYAYWKFNRSVRVDAVDMRLTSAEVSGQEILTRDKVSLRINLAASYLVTDPVKAKTLVKDYADQLYRELQFALRQAVGTRSLDALLADKNVLDEAVHSAVKERMAEYGVDVRSVGVKDVILPGEMKDILNRVVLAEKEAQANLIKRREETAATRSLLNTARLMEENKVLLRLKELETLEKVTEKVDKITVFGGLDAVLKDTVRIDVEGS